MLLEVEQPLVNVEERIDKIVGRRTKTPDPLAADTIRKADAIAWREAFGGISVPRGIHRFNTHEEANEWLWRMIARPRPN
jgi:predicted transcriptional regulator